MSVERFQVPIKYVDGFPCPLYLTTKNVRETIKWVPYDDDIIVATYPKCGTTWMQAIVWLLHHDGEGSLPRFNDMMIQLTPYIESIGVEAAKAAPSPRHLKTHLPFHLGPKNPEAKYITVARNPKDVCVSYHFFVREMCQINEMEICTFDQFFEEFMRGEVPYGDYFNHIMSWYNHKDDPNVLFMVYEKMKKNHSAAVMEIARFLSSREINYEKKLSSDSNLLRKIVEKTTFDAMKNLPVNNLAELVDPRHVGERPGLINFYRKGEVGDWQKHFSESQVERISVKTQEKFGDIVNEFGWNS